MYNRNKEKLLRECLVDCDGYRYNCPVYTADGYSELCVWYRIIENDLEKMKTKKVTLTFNGLLKLLNKERI